MMEDLVLNLSKRNLTRDERRLLNKGLSFAPTCDSNQVDIHIDLFKFIWKLKLKKFFATKAPGDYPSKDPPIPISGYSIQDIEDPFLVRYLAEDEQFATLNLLDELRVKSNTLTTKELKLQSKFVPQLPVDNVIDTYYKAVSQDFYHLAERRKKHPVTMRANRANLSYGETIALKALKSDTQIVIKEVDKGEGALL